MFEPITDVPPSSPPVSGPAEKTAGGVVVDLLATASAELAGMDWASMRDGALLVSMAALVRSERRVQAAIAVGAWQMERSGSAVAVSGLSAGGWLAGTFRGCGGEAAWRVRAGRLIGEFPALGAVVRDGELGLEHLRALDEVRDPVVREELADQDVDLLDAALRLDLGAWRREVRARVAEVREGLDRRRTDDDHADGADVGEWGGGQADPGTPDGEGGEEGGEPGAEPDDGAPDGAPVPVLPDDPVGGEVAADPSSEAGSPTTSREPDPAGWLSVRSSAGGGLLVRGELFGESAELLRQALAAEASRRRRAAWIEHEETGAPMPLASELRARALTEMVRRSLGIDLGATTGPRTDAIIVITAAGEDAARKVRALDGEPLSSDVASLLACDANLAALVVDMTGQPLWMGRSSRLATVAQRRALAIRDGGCVFPGCGMPAEWCDAHHEPGWQRGGATDLDGMVLLCRRHHGAAHSDRWTIRTATGSLGGPVGEVPRGAAEGADLGVAVLPHMKGVPRERDRAHDDPHGRQAPVGLAPGGRGPAGQRFEWFDRRTGRVLPAGQRGLLQAA